MLERLTNDDNFEQLPADSLNAVQVQRQICMDGGTAVRTAPDGLLDAPGRVSSDRVPAVWRLWWAECP